MNSLINNIFERITLELSKLSSGCIFMATLSHREIQIAVPLLLPGELARHAVSEGAKAVAKFISTKSEVGGSYGHDDEVIDDLDTLSAKAGLQFPVRRIGHLLVKGELATRVSACAPVYLASVLEYLSAEILELAGNVVRDNKKNRIVPRHIIMAVRNNEELDKLFGGVIIAGVLPNIHSVLVPKGGEKKEVQVPAPNKK